VSAPDAGSRATDPPGQADADDHGEIDLGPVAGVCDRGLRHRTNDDAMSLAVTGPALIAVVCDGVSSTPGSGPAAAAAASAACTTLSNAISSSTGRGWVPPGPGGQDGGPGWVPGGGHDLETGILDAALHDAAAAAQRAVTDIPPIDPMAAPSCTLVAAVVIGDVITVGWIGDSRAYLIGSGGAVKLTEDDTWAAEAARAGLIPESAVETDRRAHTLTRWLGADADDLAPHVRAVRTDRAARLVVCSDGLWNYASDPLALASIIDRLPPDAPPLAVARELISFALDAGGHDNITAVVADVPAHF
jgi:serine/threonine protein phosphatase PrpC